MYDRNKISAVSLTTLLMAMSACSKGEENAPKGEDAAPAKSEAAPAAKEKAPSVKWDPALKKEVDAFAACEDKNTNCAAYKTLEAYLKEAAKDDKEKVANFDALMSCVDTGTVDEVHACSYAAWAFSGYAYEAPKQADYGQRLLAAARKLKPEEQSYVGSSVGQFLASWLNHPELKDDLSKVMVDASMERRVRSELMRLCGEDCSKEPSHFASLKKVASSADENEELRTSAIGALSRVGGVSAKMEAEGLLLKTLEDKSNRIARAAAQSLGTMGSAASYVAFLKFAATKKADKDWVYQIGSTLMSYFRRDDLELDRAKGSSFAVAIAQDASLPAVQRSSVVRALGYSKATGAQKALKTLAKDKDAAIAKAAKEALERFKK